MPGSNGYGELQAQNSGQVVAVANGSTAQGSPDIVQQARNEAANTMWQPIQRSDGSYEFKNQNSGLCLDVYGAGGTLGQQLDQWPCKNAPGTNQDFGFG
ncbi:RICIN domain-containing protein [Actinoallomurus sp. NPDC052274]|uniref:RICIN domain-containing protein n=1 Tax=Actinoallomurus sp. NPDC052274 TaxID=3155420 RepID=UPI0034214DA8